MVSLSSASLRTSETISSLISDSCATFATDASFTTAKVSTVFENSRSSTTTVASCSSNVKTTSPKSKKYKVKRDAIIASGSSTDSSASEISASVAKVVGRKRARTNLKPKRELHIIFPAATATSSTTDAETTLSDFRFKRGEKTRKLVQRLKNVKVEESQKRNGTSHQKFKGEEGKKMTIPLGGSNHHQISLTVVTGLKRSMGISR